MSNEQSKKPRVMTAKGYLAKATGKAAVAAEAFLLQYREWLTTGELAEVTSPILRKLDDKQILPTPALKMLNAAVLGHMIAKDTRKVEKDIEDANKPGSQKPWHCGIYNAEGILQTRINTKGEEEDLAKAFDHNSNATGWVDRRLFDGASDWYGEILHLPTSLGVVVERGEAIARILKKPSQGAARTKGVTTRTLGFGVKCRNDRASFSRG
jgi:hypothetical protein